MPIQYTLNPKTRMFLASLSLLCSCNVSGQHHASPTQALYPGETHLFYPAFCQSCSSDSIPGRTAMDSSALVSGHLYNQGVYASADQLLEGRIPGLVSFRQGGQPGGMPNFLIRGLNTIRISNDPLFVVDGIPLDGRSASVALMSGYTDPINRTNPLTFLNTLDIESIRVLKSGFAKARYGMRGANGAVIIQTKEGISQHTQAIFSAGMGMDQSSKTYNVLPSDTYRDALGDYGLLQTGDGRRNENPQRAILRDAMTHYLNFSIGRKTNHHQYRFSIGLQDFEGIVKESGLKKYHLQFKNSTFLIQGRTGFDFSFLASHLTEELAPISPDVYASQNLVREALWWNPTIPLIQNGSFTTAANNETPANISSIAINPLQLLDAHDETAETTTILATISPYLNISSNLQYRYTYGVSYGKGVTRGNLRGTGNFFGVQGLGFAGISSTDLITQSHDHTLHYTVDFNDILHISAEGGFAYQQHDFRGVHIAGRGFSILDRDNTTAIQNGDVANRIISSFADPVVKLQAFYGLANINWKDRYFIDLAVRHEGSSKLGANRKYMTFPGVRLTWQPIGGKNEQHRLLSGLVLWLDWGRSGNQGFPAGAALERYELKAKNSGSDVIYIYTSNPDLKAEISSSAEIGMRFGLFGNRVNGGISLFNRVTTNLLLDPFVNEPGPASVKGWKNMDGKLINNGLEITLRGLIIHHAQHKLVLDAYASVVSNKLQGWTSGTIRGGVNIPCCGNDITQVIRDGQPLSTFYLNEFSGFDEQGQSIISGYGEEKYFGTPFPELTFGISVSWQFHKLSLGMLWNGASGNEVYNFTSNNLGIGNLGTRNIQSGFYRTDNPESISNAGLASSRFLEKGNYLRLTNASVAYRLGKFRAFEDVTIRLTGYNLLLFTRFSGFDPQLFTVNPQNPIPSFGITYFPYPAARSLLFNIDFTF